MCSGFHKPVPKLGFDAIWVRRKRELYLVATAIGDEALNEASKSVIAGDGKANIINYLDEEDMLR